MWESPRQKELQEKRPPGGKSVGGRKRQKEASVAEAAPAEDRREYGYVGLEKSEWAGVP